MLVAVLFNLECILAFSTTLGRGLGTRRFGSARCLGCGRSRGRARLASVATKFLEVLAGRGKAVSKCSERIIEIDGKDGKDRKDRKDRKQR